MHKTSRWMEGCLSGRGCVVTAGSLLQKETRVLQLAFKQHFNRVALAVASSPPKLIGTKSKRVGEVESEPAETDVATSVRLKALFKETGVNVQYMSHLPTRTSVESASVRGVPLASGAKAMLVRIPLKKGGDPAFPWALCVLSATKKLDWKLVRKFLGSSKAKMASVDEVHAVTGCVPGAVPPIARAFPGYRTTRTTASSAATSTGSIARSTSTSSSASPPQDASPGPVAVRTLFDASLFAQGPVVNFNCGLRTLSALGLPAADLLDIAMVGNRGRAGREEQQQEYGGVSNGPGAAYGGAADSEPSSSAAAAAARVALRHAADQLRGLRGAGIIEGVLPAPLVTVDGTVALGRFSSST